MAKTYATLDPANKHANITLSGGDLVATRTTDSGSRGVRGTIGVSAGKWYWEITATSMGADYYMEVGIGTSAVGVDNQAGYYSTGYGYGANTGLKGNNNTYNAYGSSWREGIVIGVALDMDAGKVWFSRNGTWQNSGDPAAGTGEAFSGLSGTFYPFIAMYRSASPAHVMTANFGASVLSYTPPSGFKSGLFTGGYVVSGTVLDSNGDPAARNVFAYVQSTGALAGSDTSDAGDGSYLIDVDSDADHFVVATGEASKNALILSDVTPVQA